MHLWLILKSSEYFVKQYRLIYNIRNAQDSLRGDLSVELRELISFYHVARLRSVSKAARTLELGQPTVTTHLRKLESEFGITLFDRIKRPIQLTSEGITLLELVTPVVTSVDTLKNPDGLFGAARLLQHRSLPGPGDAPPTPRHPIFSGPCTPDVRIRLLARAYSPLIQLVRSGEVDLGLLFSSARRRTSPWSLQSYLSTT